MNKVSSRVELLFDVAHSSALPPATREHLKRTLGDRLDEEGVLHVVVDQSRSQWQNREIAVQKVVSMIRAALVPRLRRIPTSATRASKTRRRESKAARGLKKRQRKPPSLES